MQHPAAAHGKEHVARNFFTARNPGAPLCTCLQLQVNTETSAQTPRRTHRPKKLKGPRSPVLEPSGGETLNTGKHHLKNITYSGRLKITVMHMRPELMSSEGHWNKQPLVFSWLGN